MKCSNSPQGANAFTDGFKCCHSHVKVLQMKGLKINEINDYLDWSYYTEMFMILSKKLRKENDLQKKQELKQKIESISNYIKNKFSKSIIQKFRNVRSYGKVIRRSRRISDKTNADMNESNIMEEDSQFLDDMEKIFGEKVDAEYILRNKKGIFFLYLYIFKKIKRKKKKKKKKNNNKKKKLKNAQDYWRFLNKDYMMMLLMRLMHVAVVLIQYLL